MVTGSTAAMIYGMPRVTHDIDLVVQLQLSNINSFRDKFPEQRFYIPPEDVLRIEINRRHRGHFNIIDQETGFKADVYLSGQDELHSWAFTRKIQYSIENEIIWIAPPEYIILRKLEYYKEGGSNKHLEDIRNMIEVSGNKIDTKIIKEKAGSLGLQNEWKLVASNS
jgi:hypothetical protein